MQHTLAQSYIFHGIGLHTGRAVTMSVKPAGIDHGIVFKRIDVIGKENTIPAKYEYVVDTRLCTVIGNREKVTIGTIEHLMAAFHGMGIDNALVEVDAPELPVMDGSSREYVAAFTEIGLSAQNAPRRAVRILKNITVTDGDKKASLAPSSVPVYAGTIDYADPTIGRQSYEMTLVNGNFAHDLADCRTFCLAKDVEMMRSHGLALGGSLDNAVVVDDSGVMNDEGLRCSDEFIRHKLLDAIGDLALAGMPILGRYEGLRLGHDMNSKLLKALFADPSSFEIVDLYVDPAEGAMVGYAVAEEMRISA